MIVDDLDVERVAIRKFEAQAPTTIDRHRRLISPVPLQLVKADSAQIAEFCEVRRGIQGCKQLVRRVHVEPAESRSLAEFVESPSRRIRERLYHTRLYYGERSMESVY
jgi:hypothetical protein